MSASVDRSNTGSGATDYTTVALGEEGDPDPSPDVIVEPDPIGDRWDRWGEVTTDALGEEGDPDPGPDVIVVPDPIGDRGGEVTTQALGEEGDTEPELWM